ncbi:MAG TPA: crotonase/enoyl-CoA hydratase family protein [Smithellaceae bacterium]|nr:crotonase/enoyl-CoA hydratase family protein [Smithellaceae bacterium]HRS82999.1 crotonase/enoyl-CoA hydratase family protein [Smithellaceae bacterium]HRV44262.1 crotonase/enoyl-CoA hydratase family protein [Smithellaceae bacterium]
MDAIEGEIGMETPSSFKVEKTGHVAWLILNRPKQRNTMTMEFFQEMRRLFKAFDEDVDVRVVAIRAEGKSFTAGLDLVAAQSLLGDGSAVYREELRRKIMDLQESITAIENCRKPVIAAIHGHCIGGGVDLTSACDIRLASKDAVFSIRETRIGIIADIGTLQRVPSIIGQGWFRELALTGRDWTAEESLKMGYITRLCEDPQTLFEEARALAEEIAHLPPLAIQGIKEVANYSRDHGIQQGLEYVAQRNAALVPNDDMIEAVAAFLEKRAPKFRGR